MRNHSRQSWSPHPRAHRGRRRHGAHGAAAAQRRFAAGPSRRTRGDHHRRRSRAARSRATSPAVRWRAPRPTRRSCETPQSLSVIGSEQIRDQKPGKFDEILRYTPGVVAGTFGADNRNDWFLIRGFKSDDVGLFLDGLQLFYTSYASWKLQPLQPRARRSVARSLAPCCMAAPAPAASSTPSARCRRREPIRYLETGVNNFGNAYLAFDFGGPVAIPRRKRQAVLSTGRPDPERRHPGRFHARQQLLHRAIADLQARCRYDLHRARRRRRRMKRAA